MGIATPALSQKAEFVNPSKTAPFHIPSLDGMRAIAFLIVFVSHAGLRDLVPGGFGVSIFFVLSGFLITTLLRMESARFGRIDLLAFYTRRVFRILPLLYLTLGVAISLTLVGQLDGQITRSGILSQVLQWSNYYLILHGFDAVPGGTVVLWSLAVEEHFYLFFPILYRSINRRFSVGAQGWILGVACVVCLAWRLVLIFGMGSEVVRTELGTDTRFDGLLFGCLMAVVANPALDELPWLTAKRLKWLALAGTAMLLFTFLYRNVLFRYTWRFTIQGIALIPIFAYVIRAKASVTYRVLNNRWIAELGVLSYSLYLIHAILLDWGARHLHTSKLVIGVLAFVLGLIIAKLLQISVEKPLLKLRKHYERIRTLANENPVTARSGTA